MSDDDAIPMEAGEAAETGIATENVGYKEKVMAEIKTSSSHIDEIRAHTAANRIGDRAAIFQAKHDAQSPGVPKRASASPAKSSDLAAKIAQNLGDKCPRCEKAVFNAEKIEAGGKAYHKMCLRCGFGNGLGCNKVLKTFDYEEYHKVMYCKACARKQHNSALAQRSGYAGKSDFTLTGKGEGGDGTTQARRKSMEIRQSVEENSTVFERVSEAADAAAAATTGAATDDAEKDDETLSVSPPAQEEEAAAAPAETAAEAAAEEPAAQEEAVAAEAAVAEEPAAAEDDDFSPSTDYDGAEDAHMVVAEEVEAEEEAAPAPVRESVMVKTLHECPFTAPFDKNGAIWWIGTDGGNKEYENPQLTGELYLEISTLYRGKLDNLTSYAIPTNSAERIAAATYTNNSSQSWLVVDFGPERALRPSYYALKHGASGIGNALRNWVLEAQVDEFSPWVTLRTHENDTSMREEPQSVAGYELSNDKARSGFFRVFRLKQTGKNSGGNDCLFIGGIEFYGIMRIQKMEEVEG